MLNWLRAIIGLADARETRRVRDPRVDDLLEQVVTLSRDMKAIRLEWEESYESLNRAVRKLGKREKRAAAESECEDCPPQVSQPAGSNGADLLRAARSRIQGAW